MSSFSYVQNFEDVMLRRATRGIDPGFCIDIGARDVVSGFAALGWDIVETLVPAVTLDRVLNSTGSRDTERCRFRGEWTA